MLTRIVTIVGTRPEAVKMAPVLKALRASGRYEALLLATGQHGQLLDETLAAFDLAPDHRLDIGPVSLPTLEHALTARLERLVPVLVLVQGDTSSALAAALAAHALGIPIGHVEAGLRSHDLNRPWPEEGNRISIDRLSTLLFAPTATALSNLAADPQVTGQCHLTGNSGIDALMAIHPPTARPPRRPLGRRRLLATLHRRESIGAPLRGICAALRKIAARGDVTIRLPVHPNPGVREIIEAELRDVAGIELLAPLPYPAMLAELAAADLVLSDSGGLQEEAPALGVPLLILRDTTERPEALICGAARLAGTDPRTIVSNASEILDDDRIRRAMARPSFPFGHGNTSSIILNHIDNYICTKRVTTSPA